MFKAGDSVRRVVVGKSETADRSAEKRRAILEAASELVTEGGYAALSIRALSERAGVSLGLLYYYFADKHDVFEAMMQDHQGRMTEFLDAFPRDRGLEALLREMVPITQTQWRHVGRMVAVWRAERKSDSQELRDQRVGAATRQFEALDRALRETAAAEERTIDDRPELVPFVWSSLMGLADLRTQGWLGDIDDQHLTDMTVGAVLRQLTATD